MFSTMPRTGTRTSRNIFTPLRASIRLTSLRRGDDHRPGQRRALAQRELGVAGAGRQVDDEVIEFAPVDLGEERLHRLRDLRPAPDDRLLRVRP